MLGWATGVKEFNILIALLILCTFLSFRSDVFFTQGNMFGAARAFALVAIAATGQTMVINTGGIDLSAGSVLALSGITTGMLPGEGRPLIPAMIAGVLAGTVTGLINGILITMIGLPPFIATLGTVGIARGLVYVLTKRYPVTITREHDFLLNLGQGYIGAIPVPVIIMDAITLIGTIFLGQSTLGRYVYAVGGASLLGGEGTIFGAAPIGVLGNCIVFLGVVILLAVSLDMWQKKRRLRT
jgi:ribose transport system permease protein